MFSSESLIQGKTHQFTGVELALGATYFNSENKSLHPSIECNELSLSLPLRERIESKNSLQIFVDWSELMLDEVDRIMNSDGSVDHRYHRSWNG